MNLHYLNIINPIQFGVLRLLGYSGGGGVSPPDFFFLADVFRVFFFRGRAIASDLRDPAIPGSRNNRDPAIPCFFMRAKPRTHAFLCSDKEIRRATRAEKNCGCYFWGFDLWGFNLWGFYLRGFYLRVFYLRGFDLRGFPTSYTSH